MLVGFSGRRKKTQFCWAKAEKPRKRVLDGFFSVLDWPVDRTFTGQLVNHGFDNYPPSI